MNSSRRLYCGYRRLLMEGGRLGQAIRTQPGAGHELFWKEEKLLEGRSSLAIPRCRPLTHRRRNQQSATRSHPCSRALLTTLIRGDCSSILVSVCQQRRGVCKAYHEPISRLGRYDVVLLVHKG